eukprot:TRINITY_DN3854_c0_g2_i5.p1 TRINITY_DN3854_c0_g2~~TRINITY_DN3854_c0_g2_i5.p1  ORF type:complete len:575 (+),score=79.13 TRINITY_DN3854_c0_g2_i5:224-1948(+)
MCVTAVRNPSAHPARAVLAVGIPSFAFEPTRSNGPDSHVCEPEAHFPFNVPLPPPQKPARRHTRRDLLTPRATQAKLCERGQRLHAPPRPIGEPTPPHAFPVRTPEQQTFELTGDAPSSPARTRNEPQSFPAYKAKRPRRQAAAGPRAVVRPGADPDEPSSRPDEPVSSVNASLRALGMRKRQISDEDITKCFEILDTEETGAMSRAGLTNVLNQLRLHVRPEEVADMVHEVDVDASGEVDINKFAVLLRRKAATLPNESTWQMFGALDANRDGVIEPGEFERTIKAAGIDLSMAQVQLMFAQADTDLSGGLTFEEFQTAYNKFQWAKLPGFGLRLEELKSSWDLLDENRDGVLELREAKALFDRLGLPQNNERIRNMLDLAKGEMGMPYSRFIDVYKSEPWLDPRVLGSTRLLIKRFKEAQEAMYEAQRAREVARGERWVGIEVLMARRALRTHGYVRAAINSFWHLLGSLRLHGQWVSLELYLTYRSKAFKVLGIGNDDLAHQQGFAVPFHDWDGDQATEMGFWETHKAGYDQDVPAHKHPVDCMGYPGFFESIFELVDTELGCERGNGTNA